MAEISGKEILKINALFTLLNILVDYSLGFLREMPLGLMSHILSGNSMENSSYVHDFIPLLTSLNHKKDFDIGILYNSRFTETIDKTTHIFTNEVTGLGVNGLTLNECHGSTSNVKLLLELANPETVLVTFCSFTEVLDIFKTIKSERLKSHLVKWVLIFNWKEFQEGSLVTLQDLIFEGTQVTLVKREMNGVYLVLEASVNLEGDMRFIFLDRWESSAKSKTLQFVTSRKRNGYSNMNSRQLTVAANNALPYFGLGKKNPDGTYESSGGMDFSILQSLSKAMNFTYRLVRPADGGWGYPQPDGTITGMIGMVARREAHFALTGIAINAKRATVVEFTTPYIYGYLALISRAPKERNRALAVLSPFSREVWICVVIATLVTGPLLKIHSKASQVIGAEKNSLSVQIYSFYMFRNLVVQGNPIITSSWSQRMILFFWYLFCFLIYALYAGLLTATLAVPAFEKPVDSLGDLPGAVANGFTLGVTADSSNEYLFKEAKSGIYKQTWDLFNHKDRSKSFVSEPGIGIDRILKRKFIHILPYVMAELLAGKLGRNKFHFGRELFYGQYDGFALPPGAPYIHPMNVIMQRLTEGGLVQKWELEEIEKFSKKATEEVTKGKTITLVHLQAAFFIIVLGYLTAAITLAIEILSQFISGK